MAENENLKNLADSIQQYYQKNINKQIKNLANSSSKEKRLIETNLHIIEKIHDVLEDLVRQNKEKDKARMDKAYEKGASSE
ncbi:hypothetical protein ACI4A9_28520, partial [Klebsiella pneumoniae]|uniref:hypothetical protein n=1 Tax=Klebsiella pneumoniae TaxID=573 RepID=UPI0038518D7A